jgi:Fe-S cluster biogenesis protein NfuA
MSDTSISFRVREVIDRDVRPGLKIHGGDVEILEVTESGSVHLAFQNACRGCSLRFVTYAVAIRQRLLQVPGVSEVTMDGANLAPVALERIAAMYKGSSFLSWMPGMSSAAHR